MNIKICFFLVSLFSFFSCNNTNYYEEGKILYDNGDYENAIKKFKKIKEKEETYKISILLISKADSIIEVQKRENFVNDSIAWVDELKRIDSLKVIQAKALDSIKIVQIKANEKKEIEKLKKELASIKSFNGDEYRGHVSSLIIEVALFSTWGKMAKEAKMENNQVIKKLRQDISINLKKLQIREFPKIRVEYVKILKKKLWETNIEVVSFGKRKSTIQFTGGLFANNKNIKDMQSTIFETLDDFRFKRANYKWYKYDNEYTYYSINSERDSKIIIY
ncbi:hypothetical protein [Spongiivirga citrea]|uniref:Tetratricopeptide repeat protein n=1 Tax=Spongiivirga citrea TaxID=1481457 RepID=A0A6M0CGH0_9FLAO|nr:hypothetical protein [Spongiivirga citrea]NER17016.1 hypothetical protein [Spongiivirga citrea]